MIPYPLPASETEKFIAQIYLATPPQILSPMPPVMCVLMVTAFDNRDPIQQGWIVNSKAELQSKHVSWSCCVYYRPTKGSCVQLGQQAYLYL